MHACNLFRQQCERLCCKDDVREKPLGVARLRKNSTVGRRLLHRFKARTVWGLQFAGLVSAMFFRRRNKAKVKWVGVAIGTP